MKKIDPGQAISILANVGVIAGIVFLGFELRQNNSFLEQQERFTFLANVVSFNDLMATSDEAARLLYRSPNGDVPEQSVLDQYRRCDLLNGLLRRWQWEFENLAPQPDDALVAAWRSRWEISQPNDCWDSRKSGYPPPFADFMDEYVAD